MDSKPLPEEVELELNGSEPRFFTRKALDAMQRAVAEAVAEHHRLGRPVAVWRDGKVVHLYPDGSIQPVKPRVATSKPLP
jgi:hypothetical protein